MTTQTGLIPTLAKFQADRAATMDPAALAENIRFRAALSTRFANGPLPKAGDQVPDFTLQSVEGARLDRDALLAEGPIVLIFFRFAGCPVCNIALPWYDRNLRPELERRGIRLIAVSPQVPEKLGEIRSRHGLGLTVATDTGNALGRALGITFAPDAEALAFAQARGTDIATTTGAGNHDLPIPAVLLIDQAGTIRFADAAPDWLIRTEPEAIIAAADAALFQREAL